MNTNLIRKHFSLGRLAALRAVALCGLLAATARGQPIQWGLTLTTINNPITPTVATNGDGSISITGGGGDAYDNPDSITYAYQQVTGDFDIRVQVKNVLLSDPVATQPDS